MVKFWLKFRAKVTPPPPEPKIVPPSMVLAEMLAAQIIMDFDPVMTEEDYGTCKIWKNKGKIPVKWYHSHHHWESGEVRVKSASLYAYCTFNERELYVIQAAIKIAKTQVEKKKEVAREAKRQDDALKAIEKHMGIEKEQENGG